MSERKPTRRLRAIQAPILWLIGAFLLFLPARTFHRIARAKLDGHAAVARVARSDFVVTGRTRWGTSVEIRNRLEFAGRTVEVILPRRCEVGSEVSVLYTEDAPEKAILGRPEDGWLRLVRNNTDGWMFWAVLALGVLFVLLAIAYTKDAIVGPHPGDAA